METVEGDTAGKVNILYTALLPLCNASALFVAPADLLTSSTYGIPSTYFLSKKRFQHLEQGIEI